MGISQIITGASVFLTGLLPMSCHKAAPQQKAAPSTVTAGTTSSAMHNLGEVALTNHYETCVQLGDGKNCTFLPKMIDSHNVEITLSLESKTDGKTHDLTVTQVTTKSGKPFEVAVGDFQLSLTPKVVVNN